LRVIRICGSCDVLSGTGNLADSRRFLFLEDF
jgi:hypothetical protein